MFYCCKLYLLNRRIHRRLLLVIHLPHCQMEIHNRWRSILGCDVFLPEPMPICKHCRWGVLFSPQFCASVGTLAIGFSHNCTSPTSSSCAEKSSSLLRVNCSSLCYILARLILSSFPSDQVAASVRCPGRYIGYRSAGSQESSRNTIFFQTA